MRQKLGPNHAHRINALHRTRTSATRRHLGTRAVLPQWLGSDLAQRARSWAEPDALASSGSDLADFDVDRVGVRYDEPSETADPDTLQGRRVYDTTHEGMSNAGHLYGAPLAAPDRADLLEYLRGL